jgi:hypothetical protein
MESLPPRQARLFPYPNPLGDRFSPEFWQTLPRTAGVYLMRDAQGALLYVGKAKNLRQRLLSYRRARPEDVSRKVLRLVHHVHQIHWEELPDETQALLRENQLLRELKPPYNRANTRPQTYFLIGLRNLGGEIRLRLTTEASTQGDLLFGAFKGRGSVEKAFGALLRLLWATTCQDARWEFPAPLTRPKPPGLLTLPLPPGQGWFRDLRRFLEGRESPLLERLSMTLLENESIPRFFHQWIEADLSVLQEFHEGRLARHLDLRLQHGIRGRLIAQDQIDDLLVLQKDLENQRAAPAPEAAPSRS